MKIHSELNSIIFEIQNNLTSEDTDRLKEYLSHNEFGLALEYICTQIIEYDIHVSQDIFKKIHDVGISMEMDKGIWKDIQTPICRDPPLQNP